MRSLSRIKGYEDSDVKRFNQMYETLREEIAEGEVENRNVLVHYSDAELNEFQSYLVLAEADEIKRISMMRHKRSIIDFTPDEIEWFDRMHEVLSEYNRQLDRKSIEDKMAIIPPFSDIEMMEYSQYRELWISEQCKDFID